MKHWSTLLAGAGLLAACTTAQVPAQKQTEIIAPPEVSAEELNKPALKPMPSAALDETRIVSRIALGSCAGQKDDQSIWSTVAASEADLFLFIGDNVYGSSYVYDGEDEDAAGLPVLEEAYAQLSQSAPFAALRVQMPVLPIWDDHDYGRNDGGASFKKRELAEEMFDYVWAIPQDAPSRQRPGVYYSKMLGVDGKRVQIIMLDTRFFRSDLKPTDQRGAPGKERYLPDFDETKTMLGDAQWLWLEGQLTQEADLRLIVSSIQVIADGHGWEAWRMLPRERQRLYSMLNVLEIDNAVILSGDRHAGAIYKRENVTPRPLYELTASSLNLPGSVWRAQNNDTSIEPGPYRLTDMYYEANFGIVDIDWERQEVSLKLMAEDGSVAQEERVKF